MDLWKNADLNKGPRSSRNFPYRSTDRHYGLARSPTARVSRNFAYGVPIGNPAFKKKW